MRLAEKGKSLKECLKLVSPEEATDAHTRKSFESWKSQIADSQDCAGGEKKAYAEDACQTQLREAGTFTAQAWAELGLSIFQSSFFCLARNNRHEKGSLKC